jgi:hypothetical protein
MEKKMINLIPTPKKYQVSEDTICTINCNIYTAEDEWKGYCKVFADTFEGLYEVKPEFAVGGIELMKAEGLAAGSYTKGQFVRLFLSDTSNPALVLAGAKTLQLHVSMSLEDATTKDTPGTWQVQEPTGLSYDISTNALVASNETITSAVGGQTLGTLMDFYEASTLLYWQIANVSGDNQRTKGSVIVSGQARIGSIAVNAANRQVATYDTQLSGYGDYTVGA